MDDMIENSSESKLREQFNSQRARMKEMFILKETEVKELKNKMVFLKREVDEKSSQLVIAEYNREKDLEDQKLRYQQEIQTLQQLISETCDESALANSELKRLNDEKERQKQEIDSNKSLDPFLSQVKTLTRKIGFGNNSQDNLEDAQRKVPSQKYASEDAEVLRSLVVPLEDEIQQLKEKLRNAYVEMEQIKGADSEVKSKSALVGMLNELEPPKEEPAVVVPHPEITANVIDPDKQPLPSDCNMCKNYELQLVIEQEKLENEKLNVVKAEKLLERMKEDLQKESKLRLELESQWQAKREEHKDEVQKLCDNLNESERKVLELHSNFEGFRDDITREMHRVSLDRHQINEHLEMLQKDNDYLSGCYVQTSEDLKDQEINLPQNIEELHELVLKYHEDLIVTKVGQEFSSAKCLSFRDESNLLRDQLHQRDRERISIEQQMKQRIHSLEEYRKQQQQQYQNLVNEKEELQRIEVEYKKQSSELRMQNIELSEALDRMEKSNMDQKSRMSMMQQEMVTNEAVQKDFVKLSQSLQMQLEKIRSEDVQVRWQDDDDITHCVNCKKEFTVTRRKHHCRHCGTIFCENCLCKSVKTGSSGRMAKVCNICHTLLVQNSAPYFSNEAPQSPM
ncbi:unnamed protein product [Diamesa tonsa]